MKRLHKLVLVALGLILVAVAVNLTDPTRSLTRLVKGESTLEAQYAKQFKPGKPVPPVGSATAKVQIALLAQMGNHCHQPSVTYLKKVAGAAPSHIRVKFVESWSPDGMAIREKAEIHCETGILVNGQSTFKVKGAPVSFHGPVGGGTSASDLVAVVRQELQKQYGKAVTKAELAKLAALAKNPPPAMPQAQPSPKNAPAAPKGKQPASGNAPQPRS